MMVVVTNVARWTRQESWWRKKVGVTVYTRDACIHKGGGGALGFPTLAWVPFKIFRITNTIEVLRVTSRNMFLSHFTRSQPCWGASVELLTVKSHCVVRYRSCEGDGADSSYDVMTVSHTSRSEDSITNIQTVRNMKQRWFCLTDRVLVAL